MYLYLFQNPKLFRAVLINLGYVYQDADLTNQWSKKKRKLGVDDKKRL